MGESNAKRRSHAAILEKAKGCIYCAEKSPATQIDHMPPRSMFRMQQRPKGLEFPSCAACNQGTSRLDVVATFMARTYPGIDNEADSAEWDKVLKEVTRVAPKIVKEMWMPEPEMRTLMQAHDIYGEKLAAFRADGPVLSAHMQAYAAKIGFALHYEYHQVSVPESGRVQVRWFTSHEVVSGHLPDSLTQNIGPVDYLRQGKITSEFTFEYGHGKFEGRPEIDLYYAKVRDSFVAASFVVCNDEHLPFMDGDLATFSPGDLKEEPYDRITNGPSIHAPDLE